MWGVYWIPLTHLESLGLVGATAGIALYIGCLILLLPAIWRYRGILVSQWRLMLFSGLLTGAAFSSFTTSLAYTEVIRSILLFYLTPVWGTLLGIVFLKEQLTRSRVMVIIVAFCGLYIILGGGGLPVPRNIGDIFALASGILWAIGSFGLLRAQSVPALAQMIGFLIGGLVVSLLTFAALNSGKVITLPPISDIAPFAIMYGFYALPMIWLTIAPARLLSPARVGILLMSEIIVGAISAALLSGEPFGTAELAGTILIITAALIEVRGSVIGARPKAS